MKKILAASMIFLALSGSAMANQCPSLWAKAEEAMKTTTLDDEAKTKVIGLITQGKADHEAGKHAESEAGLMEALKLLGV